MSYILDALKKNRSDKEQSKVPDLSSEHGTSSYDYDEYEEESTLSRWLWPVIVMVLLLTIGILSFMLLNPSAEQVSKQIIQQPTTQETGQTEKPSLTTDKPAPVEKMQHSDTVITRKPLQVSEPVVQRKTRQSVSSNNQSVNNDSQKNIQETQTKSLTISKDALPKLIYTTHIYATQSKDRFVMINGRPLSEGDTISKNLIIKEILENDLVVAFKGQEFVLPALEDVNAD